MTEEQKAREAFEAKASPTYNLNRREDGHYESRDTECAWKGWLACWIGSRRDEYESQRKAPHVPEQPHEGKVEGLREDLSELIRVSLTNPAGLQCFIQSNYPKEYAAHAKVQFFSRDLSTPDHTGEHPEIVKPCGIGLPHERGRIVRTPEQPQAGKAIRKEVADQIALYDRLHAAQPKHNEKAAEDIFTPRNWPGEDGVYRHPAAQEGNPNQSISTGLPQPDRAEVAERDRLAAIMAKAACKELYGHSYESLHCLKRGPLLLAMHDALAALPPQPDTTEVLNDLRAERDDAWHRGNHERGGAFNEAMEMLKATLAALPPRAVDVEKAVDELAAVWDRDTSAREAVLIVAHAWGLTTEGGE